MAAVTIKHIIIICVCTAFTYSVINTYIYAFNKSLYGVNPMAYFDLEFYVNTISEPGPTWFTYCTYNI